MTSKQIEFIFNDAGVKLAIVSNQFQLNKVMRAYPDIPSLEKVILIAEKGPIPEPDTVGFSCGHGRGGAIPQRTSDDARREHRGM